MEGTSHSDDIRENPDDISDSVDTDDHSSVSEGSSGSESDDEGSSGDEADDDEDEDDGNENKRVSLNSNYLSAEMKLDCEVFDIPFHPKKDVFATALITGTVKLFEFSKNQKPKELLEFKYHKKPCRAAEFDEGGDKIITVSKDKAIHVLDLNAGSLSQSVKSAHSEPINTLKIINNNFFATGDDSGTVKLWDLRSCASVAEFSENKDFISDMDVDSEKRHLVCSSGDGTLSVFNVKNRKHVDRSDQMDDELLSVSIMKNGKKVVCGGSEGTLHIFSWGQWGDISDRFPGQPLSIDTLCPVTDSLVCTGSMDGSIRLLHIQPNKFIGTVGGHCDLPIEKLRLSHDDAILGSCSHEEIKLWKIGDYCEGLDLDESLATKTKSRKRKLEDGTLQTGFFDDL